METEFIKRENILGSRRLENYVWTILLTIGGIGFLLASCSSYFKIDILPFAHTIELNFIPQGILMLVYGTGAILTSIYLGLIIIWDVGGGYNEFDLSNATIRLVRKGFPGASRNILLSYPINEIKSIEVEIKEGINPRRAIYLITIDNRRIPLTGVGEPMPLFTLEEKATTLAKFLNIPYNYV
tara:strand:- start:364 stop:912 length:549 start_codon:yes stop_codon:yes gene_type:complete